MKKLYFLLFFAVSFIANAQIVNIPDANFKAKLLSATSSNTIASTDTPIYNATSTVWSVTNYHTIDTNGDGEIQVSEAQAIKWLKINNSLIYDLTGIEAFTNLIFLDCSNNELTSLDVTSLTNLICLNCKTNMLTSLNVVGMSNLKHLTCTSEFPPINNPLTSLDLNGLINLELLQCSGIHLTSLDVTQLTNLKQLICGSDQLIFLNVNGLTNLTKLSFHGYNLLPFDVSTLTNLENLLCSYNHWTSIDVSNLINLKNFVSYSSDLSTLDLSNSPNLEQLAVEENPSLVSLFLKNGADESYISFNNCPNIEFICADDSQITQIQNKINQYGYTNCHVNSYCNFHPGGNFYVIKGNNKWDLNNNGCDVNDDVYPNLKFIISDFYSPGAIIISNTSGEYYFPVTQGNHTITPVLENPTYFNISPSSFTVDFPTQVSPFTQDFCITANGVHRDVEIFIVPTNPARPGFDANYKIVYRNKGNQIENGSVSLNFDDAVLDYVSSNPVYNSNAMNTFTWNYTNLKPFETREIEISFNVNSPMESPAVNNGDILNYTATITTANTDETPADNTFNFNQTVVGSYDPNDKTCLEGETVDVSMVGKYVHYIIRFENTGTYPAENIVIKDMIDTSKFNVSTLVPLHGSHEFYTRINYNKFEFIFENINLDFNDATNDGYVAFKIKTKSNLTVGQTFSNDANIYFDYNFPITTNEYITTIQNLLSNQDFSFENEFVLYPNPATAILNISAKNQTEIQSVEIYNIVGQVVIAIPNSTKAIDVSSLETGTYFIKLNTEKGSTTTKFLKE